MDKINTILKALKIICEQNEIKPSGDMYLDCAVRIYATHYIQKSKNGGSDLGATDKQKTAMTNMKIPFKDDISKEEASQLIDKKIKSFSS